MGLSFHYNAIIRDSKHVQELTTEVKDICLSLGWEFQIWPLENLAGDNPDYRINNYELNDLKGISFTPENCETVFLTFLPDNNLVSPVDFILGKELHPYTNDRTLSTKTQFAGIDCHLAIMKLMLYLKEKYFSKLDITDEGQYWETKNEDILKKQFQLYEGYLNAVSDAFSELKSIPGESPASLADRIEQILNTIHQNISDNKSI